MVGCRQLREALAPSKRSAQLRRVVDVARRSATALDLFLAVADTPSLAEGTSRISAQASMHAGAFRCFASHIPLARLIVHA